MLDYTLDRDKSKVWIINQYAITPDLPGGTRHYDLGCELVKRGYVVRIFASDVNLALRRHTRLDGSELFCDEEVNGVISVSYTHLDVYKRQLFHRFAE